MAKISQAWKQLEDGDRKFLMSVCFGCNQLSIEQSLGNWKKIEEILKDETFIKFQQALRLLSHRPTPPSTPLSSKEDFH